MSQGRDGALRWGGPQPHDTVKRRALQQGALTQALLLGRPRHSRWVDVTPTTYRGDRRAQRGDDPGKSLKREWGQEEIGPSPACRRRGTACGRGTRAGWGLGCGCGSYHHGRPVRGSGRWHSSGQRVLGCRRHGAGRVEKERARVADVEHEPRLLPRRRSRRAASICCAVPSVTTSHSSQKGRRWSVEKSRHFERKLALPEVEIRHPWPEVRFATR